METNKRISTSTNQQDLDGGRIEYEQTNSSNIFINFKNKHYDACLHGGCPECGGSGIKKDGTMCIHYITCFCSKCRITY